MNLFPLLAALDAPHTVSSAAANDDRPESRALLWVSLLAAAFLLAMTSLAFSTRALPSMGDRVALIFLAFCAAIIGWTPLRRHLEGGDGRNAASFGLCAAMFLVYGMARRVTPIKGPSLRFDLLPDETFPLSHAAFIVVPAALICAIALRIAQGKSNQAHDVSSVANWPRALMAAFVIVALSTVGSFQFLRGFYAVGATEILDPTPLVQTITQVVEYLALALLCHVATAHVAVRRAIFVFLPLVLMALWARHHFAAPLPAQEDEE